MSEKGKDEMLISMCGLVCSDCNAYIATLDDDDEKRIETAKLWAKEYNRPDLKPEDINCSGCLSKGRQLFDHCMVCEIRKCGLEKDLESCAFCSDFSCEKLERLLKMVPDARERLQKLRQ